MAAAIDVRRLRKSFGGHGVLDDLNLTVRQGEVFALLGANGSGKTTTINILTTLLRPDSGTALVAGCDVLTQPEEVKRRISLTGQAAAVDDVLTGVENVRLFARLSGFGRRQARRRADELLERFGLTDAATRRVGSYSGGMRRRLDLALSFVFTPQVLFLDEPTTGLDTRSRQDVWQDIRGMARAGTTVFLTTQYLDEADQLADRIGVLDGGRIAGLGTPGELKARLGGTTVALRDAHGEVLTELPTDGSIAGLRRALDALEESGAAGTVSLRQPTLDDVFLALTSGGASTARSHGMKEPA